MSVKQHYRMEETEVIRVLIDWGKTSKRILAPFDFMIFPLLTQEEWGIYEGFLVAQEVPRSELGFDPKVKPGDFDVIIIPYSKQKVYLERTVVFEIKVVRPTRDKPGRNANKMGTDQLRGLIRDGFPLVALMHVSMTEPLLEREKTMIQQCKKPIKLNDPSPENLANFKDTEEVGWDWFGLFATDQQMKRLLTHDIPKYAGLRCGELAYFGEEEFQWSTCSQDYWPFEAGYYNPHKKVETIERIKDHLLNYPHRYMNKRLHG